MSVYDGITLVCTITTVILTVWNVWIHYQENVWREAKLFSVWSEDGFVVLQNAGSAPIYDLIITAVSTSSVDGLTRLEEAMLMDQQEKASFPLSGADVDDRDGRVLISLVPPGIHHSIRPSSDFRKDCNAQYEVRFRDAANRYWLRDGSGVLHKLPKRGKDADYCEGSAPLRSISLRD